MLTAALGPLVKAGAVDSHRYDHYSLERTLATAFAVAPLARARTARVIGDIWRGTTNGPRRSVERRGRLDARGSRRAGSHYAGSWLSLRICLSNMGAGT